MRNLAERIYSCGPGGRKCGCCNDLQGIHKPKMNRIVRRRLKVHFNKEIQVELNSKD